MLLNKFRILFNKLFLVLIAFSFIDSFSKAGINKNVVSQWSEVQNEFYIDTVDFEINKSQISAWIKEKNYKRRKLTIDCENLQEKELFDNKIYGWNSIKKDSPKFIIANQLCFLTEVLGYTSEPRRKQPKWVKKMISLHSARVSKKNQELEELKKKEEVTLRQKRITNFINQGDENLKQQKTKRQLEKKELEILKLKEINDKLKKELDANKKMFPQKKNNLENKSTSSSLIPSLEIRKKIDSDVKRFFEDLKNKPEAAEKENKSNKSLNFINSDTDIIFNNDNQTVSEKDIFNSKEVKSRGFISDN